MNESPAIDDGRAIALVEAEFERSIVPTLCDYIRIPNKSPDFDPEWEAKGHMARAMRLIVDWCEEHSLDGMSLELIESPGRTPLLLIEVPGDVDDTVLLYGHMDKQPETTGWAEGLGPWEPVLRGDRLYGRGGADDGYAIFSSLMALRILRDQGIAHARCVVIIEASEESGSPDLPYYIGSLRDRIGTPSLVVCLDSGAGNYEQLWCTTSLRGLVTGNLYVQLMSEGVHSGDAGGVVPSSFRVARALLERLEDASDGRIIPEWLHAAIPVERLEQATAAAEVLGNGLWERFSFVEGAGPMNRNPIELILNRTWRPQLEVTGAAGMPALGDAGNVLRPATALRLSLRLPPVIASRDASDRLAELLMRDPPYGAEVRFEPGDSGDGWNAPAVAPWLEQALAASSETYFGRSAMYMGEGGTIPFMGMLGAAFPDAQFLITGVLGPGANAHGPNEFLHLPTARRLTCCVAETIRRHAMAD